MINIHLLIINDEICFLEEKILNNKKSLLHAFQLCRSRVEFTSKYGKSISVTFFYLWHSSRLFLWRIIDFHYPLLCFPLHHHSIIHSKTCFPKILPLTSLLLSNPSLYDWLHCPPTIPIIIKRPLIYLKLFGILCLIPKGIILITTYKTSRPTSSVYRAFMNLNKRLFIISQCWPFTLPNMTRIFCDPFISKFFSLFLAVNGAYFNFKRSCRLWFTHN